MLDFGEIYIKKLNLHILKESIDINNEYSIRKHPLSF